jgi:hypothetical protein
LEVFIHQSGLNFIKNISGPAISIIAAKSRNPLAPIHAGRASGFDGISGNKRTELLPEMKTAYFPVLRLTQACKMICCIIGR